MYWNKSSLLDDPRPIMECIPEHLSHRDKMAERILMTLNTDTEHYEYTSLFSSQWKKEFYDIETRYDCCLSLLSDVNPIFLTNGILASTSNFKTKRKETNILFTVSILLQLQLFTISLPIFILPITIIGGGGINISRQ